MSSDSEPTLMSATAAEPVFRTGRTHRSKHHMMNPTDGSEDSSSSSSSSSDDSDVMVSDSDDSSTDDSSTVYSSDIPSEEGFAMGNIGAKSKAERKLKKKQKKLKAKQKALKMQRKGSATGTDTDKKKKKKKKKKSGKDGKKKKKKITVFGKKIKIGLRREGEQGPEDQDAEGKPVPPVEDVAATTVDASGPPPVVGGGEPVSESEVKQSLPPPPPLESAASSSAESSESSSSEAEDEETRRRKMRKTKLPPLGYELSLAAPDTAKGLHVWKRFSIVQRWRVSVADMMKDIVPRWILRDAMLDELNKRLWKECGNKFVPTYVELRSTTNMSPFTFTAKMDNEFPYYEPVFGCNGTVGHYQVLADRTVLYDTGNSGLVLLEVTLDEQKKIIDNMPSYFIANPVESEYTVDNNMVAIRGNSPLMAIIREITDDCPDPTEEGVCFFALPTFTTIIKAVNERVAAMRKHSMSFHQFNTELMLTSPLYDPAKPSTIAKVIDEVFPKDDEVRAAVMNGVFEVTATLAIGAMFFKTDVEKRNLALLKSKETVGLDVEQRRP
jgi:hypothetical protein